MSEQVLPRTTVVTKPSSVLTEAYAYGLAGVLMFSGGIVATRMAVLELPPVFVGAGRAAVAGLLSLLLLWVMRQKSAGAPILAWSRNCRLWRCICFSGVYCAGTAMDRCRSRHTGHNADAVIHRYIWCLV